MTGQAAWLVAGLLLAHFIGDYTPLATSRMQDAKSGGTPIAPIAGHALIHAKLVAVAVLAIDRPGLMIVAAAA